MGLNIVRIEINIKELTCKDFLFTSLRYPCSLIQKIKF